MNIYATWIMLMHHCITAPAGIQTAHSWRSPWTLWTLQSLHSGIDAVNFQPCLISCIWFLNLISDYGTVYDPLGGHFEVRDAFSFFSNSAVLNGQRCQWKTCSSSRRASRWNQNGIFTRPLWLKHLPSGDRPKTPADTAQGHPAGKKVTCSLLASISLVLSTVTAI